MVSRHILVCLYSLRFTFITAKNRKRDTSSTDSSSRETGNVATSRQDNVSGENEASTSHHDLTGSPKVETLSDKDNIRCQDEVGEDRSVSVGLSCSPGVTRPGHEDSSVEVNESLQENNLLGESRKDYHSEFPGDSSNELSSSSEFTLESETDTLEGRVQSKSHLQESDDFIDAVKKLPEHEDDEIVLPPKEIEDNYVPSKNDEKSTACFAEDQNGDFHEGFKPSGLDSSSEIVSHENDNVSRLKEQSFEADGIPISKSSSTEKDMNESLVSFYLTSTDEEHPDHSPREVARNFGRVSSVDTFGSSPPTDVNFRYGSMANYPTTMSYYANYDGSESSYDGMDDTKFEHVLHPSRNNKGVRSTEMIREEGFRRNDIMNGEPERNYWNTNSSHRPVLRSSHWSQGNPSETNANRTRPNKQGGVSRLPFSSNDPYPDHTSVSPSSYRRSLLPPRPLEKPSYSKPDKLDLLKTVCELKDQLNRMQFPKVADREFTTFHHDHLAPERDMYADLNHHRAKDRCNVSRLAFSGDAAHFRHQLSCSCLHCCPHYSAQLPSHAMHCKNSRFTVQNDHNCCNISNSSSPLHYTSSEHSLQGRETNETKRSRLKEKYQMARRHLLPLAGGAPFVACYHCSELLQLPADFLLFKKRYHQLMCNSCRKVLKFSLLKGNRIVPHLPDASAPPPSEAEGYSERNIQEPSSKLKKAASEMEPSSNSPLHRLMGYSSLSQVLSK